MVRFSAKDGPSIIKELNAARVRVQNDAREELHVLGASRSRLGAANCL